MAVAPSPPGDLDNTSAARPFGTIEAGAGSQPRSLSIRECDDDPGIRERYRPFLLDKEGNRADWVDGLELGTVFTMARGGYAEDGGQAEGLGVVWKSTAKVGESSRHRTLVPGFRSYSRFTAFEASRVLFRLGCDVRVYDPTGLPVKDDVQHQHEKVQELRELSQWSDGHVWVSPEQHGNLDERSPLRNVSGGSPSFNTVNSLRILGRWMRMFAIPNQSSIPKAYTQYTSEGGNDIGRLMSSGNRDRLVDCMEEFVKYTIVMKPHLALFGDRFSERQERRQQELDAKERQVVCDGKQDSSEGLEERKKVNGVQVDKI